MKIFKRIFSLTAAVLLSVPTITAPASGAEASEDGSVEVSAVSDYSVFEAIKIRRSIINQDGVYTFSDYKDVSTYRCGACYEAPLCLFLPVQDIFFLNWNDSYRL